jgi:glycosyltransferase involved in cell wall biosynthesis
VRITLLGPVHPYRGGIAHFLHTLARGLAARGHAVRAVSFRRQYPERLFPGKTQLAEGPPPPGLPEAPRLLDTVGPWTWRATARRIAGDGAEVVLFKYWMSFFAPALGTVARALRRRGVRVLAVVDNALPHERRPGDRALARYVLGACDGLIVMSDQVRRDVEALGLKAAVRQVAHPTYDLFGEPVARAAARQSLGLPAEAPVLLFFGFIRRYKGLHVLLDAMPRILDRLPDARLVVAGEFYADEAELRAQAGRLGLGEAVRFAADYIPDEQVGAYFGAADVVVQPYVSATQSGVAGIAYHFGTPVVTTDVGGLAETVPDGVAGLVVPPEDPAALADAVVRFFAEPGLAERLEAGVRAERETYSWERVYEAIEALAAPAPGVR